MLGKKIRKLRTEKKMTQAQLADGFITRNMLSQIENGLALPSVSTLAQIAVRLGVPIEYFLSESDELGAFIRLSKESKIRDSFSRGEFDACIKLLSDCGDGESELILSMCFEKKGQALIGLGELYSARECFSFAKLHAENSAFASDVSKRAEKHISSIDCVLGRGEIPTAEFDICSYVAELAGKSTFQTRHREARKLISDGKYDEAEKKLGALLSEAKETSGICEYYLLSDLELCLKKQGDFERAYSCADRRLALREKMNR